MCGECAVPGDLEKYISGRGVEQRFGKSAEEIDDPKVWEELAEWFAVGLNNTIVHWSPDVLVLGGSMIIKDVGIPVGRVEYHLKNIVKIFPELPDIKKAELGDVGGLYGGLELIKQNT